MSNGIRTGDPRGFHEGRSSVKVTEFDKHLKKAGGHIGRNVVEITIKMKTTVRKNLNDKKLYLLRIKGTALIHTTFSPKAFRYKNIEIGFISF